MVQAAWSMAQGVMVLVAEHTPSRLLWHVQAHAGSKFEQLQGRAGGLGPALRRAQMGPAAGLSARPA